MKDFSGCIDKEYGSLTLEKLISRTNRGKIRRYSSGRPIPQKGVFKCRCGKKYTYVVSSVVNGKIKECSACSKLRLCPHRDIRCKVNYETGLCCWECDKVIGCKLACFDRPEECGRKT